MSGANPKPSVVTRDIHSVSVVYTFPLCAYEMRGIQGRLRDHASKKVSDFRIVIYFAVVGVFHYLFSSARDMLYFSSTCLMTFISAL